MASKGKKEACAFTGNFKKFLSVKEQIIGGSIARLVAQTMLHPVDTLRTRRQVRGGLPTKPMDLMKGILPQMALAMPAGAVQFVVMEKTKKALNHAFTNHTLGGFKPHLIEVLAASAGAIAASTIRVPQERVKQPVQADMYPNMFVAIASTYNANGLGGFYIGMTATLMRDVPWNALSFLFVNMFKMGYEGSLKKSPSAVDMMAIGTAGGALAAIIMTPVDVVKTRLMTQLPDAAGKLPYAGIAHCLMKVAGEEGPMALMKGVTPRCLYLGPLSAVVHTIYEKIGKQMLLAKGPNWCHIAPAA